MISDNRAVCNSEIHEPAIGQRPLPTLLALLPLIIVLEAALVLNGSDLSAARVLAHEHIGEAFHFFGLAPQVVLHSTGLAVVVILLVWHGLTGKSWRITIRQPAQLFFEGCIATAPLLAMAAFLGTMHTTSLAATIGSMPLSGIDAVVLAIGAGLSEELLFRMVGIAALHWLFVDLFKWSAVTGTALAVIATAAAFTMYHDPASLPATSTIFIAASGLYLGVLFVMRGFAVAVIAHAGYDVVVFLDQLRA